jgi:hypothetical protein
LNVSVIGEIGVSSITSGLPEAADDDDWLLGEEGELLQAASAVQRTAAAARPFMIL